jgi:hypothetical protein
MFSTRLAQTPLLPRLRRWRNGKRCAVGSRGYALNERMSCRHVGGPDST